MKLSWALAQFVSAHETTWKGRNLKKKKYLCGLSFYQNRFRPIFEHFMTAPTKWNDMSWFAEKMKFKTKKKKWGKLEYFRDTLKHIRLFCMSNICVNAVVLMKVFTLLNQYWKYGFVNEMEFYPKNRLGTGLFCLHDIWKVIH